MLCVPRYSQRSQPRQHSATVAFDIEREEVTHTEKTKLLLYQMSSLEQQPQSLDNIE